jgi:hypothetical protein
MGQLVRLDMDLIQEDWQRKLPGLSQRNTERTRRKRFWPGGAGEEPFLFDHEDCGEAD